MTPSRWFVAVDLVIFSIRDRQLNVLLVQRAIEPHLGELALPGGFVLDGEELRRAAERELREETGISVQVGHLEQLASYGAPGRDPRGNVLSVAYLALMKNLAEPVAGSDAAGSSWVPVSSLVHPDGSMTLAFDHDQILRDGLERARGKLEYSPIGAALTGDEFTVNELRETYEAVWGVRLDPRNFHRKVTNADDFIAETNTFTRRSGGRPARLFRRGNNPILHPALLRPSAQ